MKKYNSYELILEKLELIVEQASLILNKPIKSISEVQNPSTNLDHDISRFLSKALTELHEVDVLSEEDLILKTDIKSECWIVDPIDGTINFICGSPDVAISVALVDNNFNPILSVVYFPFFNQLYTALKDNGAKLNGKEISRSASSDQMVVSYGFPADANLYSDTISEDINNLVKTGFILRQSGSAAVDICRVANGIWQGFFEKRLYVWDVVAADLIAREAGCLSEINIINEKFLCNYLVSSSSSLHKDLLNRLNWD